MNNVIAAAPPPPAYPVIKGKSKAPPWAVLIYGTPGIGKSSWASRAPSPFFIDLEHGLDRIDCERSPLIATVKEFIDAVTYAASSDYATVVIDTADYLEKLLVSQVCETHHQGSLADFGYGRGAVYLASEWAKIVNVIMRLKARGKNVIITAHEQIQRLEDPTSEGYDRYTLNIDKKSAPILVAAMDGVFFAHYEKTMQDRDTDKKKKRAVATGKRLIHTVEGAAFIAKNRFGLKPTVEMAPQIFNMLSPVAKATEETTVVL